MFRLVQGQAMYEGGYQTLVWCNVDLPNIPICWV